MLVVFVQERLATFYNLLLWVSRGSLAWQEPIVSGLQGEILRNLSWKKHVLSAMEPVTF